jgi:exonuclease SbcC
MSIRILHTADWHVGDFRGPVKDGVNQRAQDTVRCLEALVEKVKEESPDITMISGDVFDKAGVGDVRAISEGGTVYRIIRELSQYSGNVIVLRGTPNHDRAEHFKSLEIYFQDYLNVHIVTKPEVVTCYGGASAIMDVACIPGFDLGLFKANHPDIPKEQENEAITAELEKICMGLKGICEDGLPSALMAHYTVPGCDTESGQSSYMIQFEPVLSPQALNAAKFDLVALGHIHRPQKLENVPNCFYSGAVNALNFNDEGQERGFYIHDLDADEGKTMLVSRFVKLPAREFKTINLDNSDITAINAGDMETAAGRWRGLIEDKMVRVKYSCTEENRKALRTAELTKQLMEDGAFWVGDIIPERIIEGTNKTVMSVNAEPEENLVNYLREKEYTEDKITELVELARPVMANVVTRNASEGKTGVFEPVSIEVDNYRNYVHEFFSFEDISCCTINGENGAGKSSLFMDAIVDCLYEDTREGEITGWIRNDDSVESGTIVFTFRLGERTYRVLRKRTKGGKPTLVLSELVDGEWLARGGKVKDTQQAIEDLIGMDVMTFKSCAVIMQDQYGLFLQASKTERMGVLARLMNLGMYDEMKETADKRRAEAVAKGAAAKAELDIYDRNLEAYRNDEEELDVARRVLASNTERFETLKATRDARKEELVTLEYARDRAERLKVSIDRLTAKANAREASRGELLRSIEECRKLLDEEPVIIEKAELYREKEKRRLELKSGLDALNSKRFELGRQQTAVKELELEIVKAEGERSDAEKDMRRYEDSEVSDIVLENEILYKKLKEELAGLQELNAKYLELANRRSSMRVKHKAAKDFIENRINLVNIKKENLEKKTELLESSGCVDIDNANCSFLKDAKAAKLVLETDIPAELNALEKELFDTLQANTKELEKLDAEISGLGYDGERYQLLQSECSRLKDVEVQADAVRESRNRYALASARKENIEGNIAGLRKRLSEAETELYRLEGEVAAHSKSLEEESTLSLEMSDLVVWLEKERQLPVVRERKQNAVDRYTELSNELSEINNELIDTRSEYVQQLERCTGIDVKRTELINAERELSELEKRMDEHRTRIGVLEKNLEERNRILDKITGLKADIQTYAAEENNYEQLKTAFSQDGIPHQIVRGILPKLAESANEILGQMTGGRMGVDFKTERIQKSTKVEKVTLDVLIAEYGKSTLPYLSKSGGEKVKASLAVILALAELKSGMAGVQLGMLFIDEPPFLDAEGVQAYCDALETIQERYKNLKVMAITHDSSMKARFPQSVDVIKTDEGSKVIR